MDPVANPYRPGAGRRPPLLAGRDALLESFDVVRRRAEETGEGERGWILNGLRGVGKTVLLNELARQVSSRGWIVAKLEAGAGESLPLALNQSLVRALRTATGRHPERRLRRLMSVFKAFSVRLDPSGSVSLGVEVDPATGVADSGRFADDLTALFEVLGQAARDLGTGVLILIDELQEATAEELIALNTAVHSTGQDDPSLPIIVVGAGLPSLPAQLAEATSYAERLYDYRPIGLLGTEAARQALIVPAMELGVDWDQVGLDSAIDAAGGYPYFIQAIGKQVWDHARVTPISLEDVQVGLAEARREVDMASTGPDGNGPRRPNETSSVRWRSLGARVRRPWPTSPRPWERPEALTFLSPVRSSSGRASPTHRNGGCSPSQSRECMSSSSGRRSAGWKERPIHALSRVCH